MVALYQWAKLIDDSHFWCHSKWALLTELHYYKRFHSWAALNILYIVINRHHAQYWKINISLHNIYFAKAIKIDSIVVVFFKFSLSADINSVKKHTGEVSLDIISCSQSRYVLSYPHPSALYEITSAVQMILSV